jgi:hypothetical protein
MRFQLLDILPNVQNPVTGRLVSTADRLEQAERLGFDAVAVGERHAGPFLSAGVTVVLGAIAAATSRVRLQTGVCVLSVLDPAGGTTSGSAPTSTSITRSPTRGSAQGRKPDKKAPAPVRWGLQ